MADGLIDLCRAAGPKIAGGLTHRNQAVIGSRLLWAIAGNESTFGKRREFVKYEPAFLPGGDYYKNSPTLQKLYYQYGVLAGSSYGSWQIMYPTACEVGFSGPPIALQDDAVAIQFVVNLINKRFIGHEGAKTLSDVLDAYNSGSFRDTNVPQKYVDDGIHHYESGFSS